MNGVSCPKCCVREEEVEFGLYGREGVWISLCSPMNSINLSFPLQPYRTGHGLWLEHVELTFARRPLLGIM